MSVKSEPRLDSWAEERERLEERMDAAEDLGNEIFLGIAQELDRNFEDYGNDFYHGTWGQSAERIMDVGLKGNPNDTILTGETGTQNRVSLTYLPSWAFHYSLDQHPNTVNQVCNFVERNYGAEPQGRNDLQDFVENLEDPKNMEDDARAYDSKILKEMKNDTQGFQEIPYSIPEDGIQVHEVVFGIDYDSIRDQIDMGKPPTKNEIEALNKNEYRSLGEVKISRVPRDELTAYVPYEFVKSYRRENSENDMDIKCYDSMMLKHELDMEETYREKGTRSFEEFWVGPRLGVGTRTEEWEAKPDKIDISC